ncbi:GntR family transcriptional regulator [Salinisphaera aquimarina]|uniref:GntR family transcriptional regulator n=1 Tax=Salinisphaera aquimarina TaxID=2094031 RepID=A0ABV7EMH8_9GAMM
MAEARYQRVARALIGAIRDGRYPVGSLLPAEVALAQHHGVSRQTVRKAIEQLHQQHLVTRRAGIGTRVQAPAQSSGYRQQLSSIDDLVQFGETHLRRVERIDSQVIDIATAEELDCLPGSRWLCIATQRLDMSEQPPQPVCWTDNFIDPAHSDIGEQVRREPDTLICVLIERSYGRRTLTVNQNASATEMPVDAAAILGVPAGSPCLRVIRHYLDELDDVFMITRTYHASERYKLRSTLRHTVNEPLS